MGKKALIVVGLGFGDEGKGLATDFLCLHRPDPLVIRFNGGQQAGHTVVTSKGKRHVFSNFGSGTLRGVPTYWSEYCTFSPGSFLKEYQALQSISVQPQLFVDKLCPVTTHYDVLYNRVLENSRGNAKHGSCGMGFGATVERHQLSPVKIYAQDLYFPAICQLKLNAVREHYRQKMRMEIGFDFDTFDHAAEDQRFMQNIGILRELQNKLHLQLVTAAEVFAGKRCFQTYIFEGAQGVLLDMDFGFFPHVTRSNTCSKNALLLVDQYLKPELSEVEIKYVSRCYQTRHGQGPMMHEKVALPLINNAAETNQHNEHQGDFRVSPLDADLLHYALQCDGNFSHGLKKKLLLTCVDHLDGRQIPYFRNGQPHFTDYRQLPGLVGFAAAETLFSFSDCAENI